MPEQTKIRYNLEGLEDLQRQVGKQYVTRVGVLAPKMARTPSPGHPKQTYDNAEIGAVHEFGSISRKIPARSFLRWPLAFKGDELTKRVGGSLAVKDAVEKMDIKRVFALIGIFAEQIVDEAFQTGGWGQWPANKPETIARKGSDKPLIDEGQLRRSIMSDVVNRSSL